MKDTERCLDPSQPNGNLVGEQASLDGEHEPVGVVGVDVEEARELVGVEGGARHSLAGSQGELQRLERSPVVGSTHWAATGCRRSEVRT